MAAAEENTPTGPSLEDLGGEAGIRKWVELFYDKVGVHPTLIPIFPPDLTQSRAKQWAFFVEYFGGPAHYTNTYGNAFLRFKHRKAKIGFPERDAWMSCLLEALAETGASPELVTAVQQKVQGLADAMVNHHPDRKDALYFN